MDTMAQLLSYGSLLYRIRGRISKGMRVTVHDRTQPSESIINRCDILASQEVLLGGGSVEN